MQPSDPAVQPEVAARGPERAVQANPCAQPRTKFHEAETDFSFLPIECRASVGARRTLDESINELMNERVLHTATDSSQARAF